MKENQDYGENPLLQRETDLYKEEYVHNFVKVWDDLINWEARAASEGDFFIRLLKDRGVKRVLDVATGTGFHSVRLLRAGFEVVSADGSPEMLSQAFTNARECGFVLQAVHADWRWLSRDVHTKFDAVICLGNSLTHLFSDRDRRKALAEFYAALTHDGILVLDQRNYDAILDHGFKSKHIFYYCGENVKAEPEYVDEGLARFQYLFPDGTKYHLNMFPLRKDYTRLLMQEVGFQQVHTYGDFQETYAIEDPDFFVHVAEKRYSTEKPVAKKNSTASYSAVVTTARDYYNSDDADTFYAKIWGGEDIHIGLYDNGVTSILEASHKTVEAMSSLLDPIDGRQRVLDIGAGYGGSARYLAKKYSCHVTCLNLSEVQNRRNRDRNISDGLELLVNVVDGNFEDILLPDESVDIVWSQDAILHSANRKQVFQEVFRVLSKGGRFIFTDPMQSAACPENVLQPILDRIHLKNLGSIDYYSRVAEEVGFEQVSVTDLSGNLPQHYAKVREAIAPNVRTLLKSCSSEYLDRMKSGLQHWVDAGNNGYLTWGILLFRKP